MHLHTGHCVKNDDATPLDVDSLAIGQAPELRFNDPGPLVGLGHRQAEAVLCQRPGADIPELDQILGGVAQLLASANQSLTSASNDSIIRVVRLSQPQEDIGIGEERHSAPQS